MSEAAVRQYLRSASSDELDKLLDLIKKLRKKQTQESTQAYTRRRKFYTDDEEKFKRENFGMGFQEFDAWIEESRKGKSYPAEEVFDRMDKYIEKLQSQKRRKKEEKRAAKIPC